MQFTLHVNGRNYSVDVDGDMPLLWVLRDEIDLKGTKFGCGVGLCGACAVHLDDAPVRSCTIPISDVGKAEVTTIEGIGSTPVGARLQEAWLNVNVGQLSAGSNHVGRCAARTKPYPERRRHRFGDGRQFMPLRNIPAHP